jgi:hypothetical protein
LARRQRDSRKRERRFIAILILAFVSSAAGVLWLTPSESEKPVVRLHSPAACDSCERYAEYLRARGFRVDMASHDAMELLRTKFPVPRSLRSEPIGTVNGLFLEGHVPAAEIHRFLARRPAASSLGLIVPGRPAGAPGLDAAVPEPFTVFLIRPGGLAQPIRTYNDSHFF